MTSKKLEEEALILSNKPYSIKYEVDETVDGQRVYLLTHPDLPGCMAQGATIEEALKELQEVRYEYLLSLLEDGLPIPSPISTTTETMGISQSLPPEQMQQKIEPDYIENLSRIKPIGREEIAIVSVVY